MKWMAGFILALMVPAMPTYAGEADVGMVQVSISDERTYLFDVTVLHDDTGWNHYADQWEIIAPKMNKEVRDA